MFGLPTLANQKQIMADLKNLLAAVDSLKTVADTAGVQLTALREEVAQTQPSIDQATVAVQAITQQLSTVTQS